MINSIDKIIQIIKEGRANDSDFFSKYADCLIGVGERQVDYCLYRINVDEHTEMLIDFIDFSLSSVSVIDIRHKGEIIEILNDVEHQQ